MSLLSKLTAELGTTPAELAKGNSHVARLMRRDGVEATAEFTRAMSLPERPPNPADDPDACRLAELLTRKYARHTPPRMTVRPAQARPLGDLADYGGCVGMLPVGTGKTFVSRMAGEVCASNFTMLLCFAALESKTNRDFEALDNLFDFKYVWPKFLSYEALGYEDGERALFAFKPEVLVCDEGHALLNPDSGRTKRVERYLQSRHAVGEPVKLLIMSGTLDQRGLMSYWHLLRWCISDEMCPVPTERAEAEMWARAIDVKCDPGLRVSPGALGETTEIARSRVQHRIRSARGVAWAPAPEVAANLRVRVWSPTLPNSILDALANAEAGIRPDGVGFDTEDDQSRCLRTLPLGFYHRYAYPPSKTFLEARARWNAIANYWLSLRRVGLDTEGQVRAAAHDGKLSSAALWAADAWRSLEPSEPPREVVWVDESVVDLIAAEAREPQLIWTHYREFGLIQSRSRHGYPYYADDGLDAEGRFVEDHPGTSSSVLSVAANSTGRNLQYKWHRNLILTQSSSASMYEQLIGRTYRPGQEADTVHVTIYAPTARSRATFFSAVQEAKAHGGMLLARADYE